MDEIHSSIFGEIRALAGRSNCVGEYDKLEAIFRMFPSCDEGFLLASVIPYMRDTLPSLLHQGAIRDPVSPLGIRHLLYDNLLYYAQGKCSPDFLASPYWRFCKSLKIRMAGKEGDSVTPFFPTNPLFLDSLESLTISTNRPASTDECLSAASKCPNLRNLALVTRRAIIGRLTFTLPNLETLRLGDGEAFPSLMARATMPKLREVQLQLTYPFQHCDTQLSQIQEIVSQYGLTARVADGKGTLKILTPGP